MISVIVPVYNSEKYLAACLDSILAQTVRDLQIICINDGSTDSSGEILAQYAKKDCRIIVLNQENSGVSAARNVGLRAAHGQYIAFADSDDILEPDMYAHLLELMQSYGADIAHCGYRKVYADGTGRDVGGTNILLIQDSGEAAQCLLSGQYFTGGLWNKLYRAVLFDGVSFDSDLKMNEDILINAIVFKKARKIVFHDVAKYQYYERAESSCSTMKDARKKADSVLAAERIFACYRGWAAEREAACKLHYALCDLYRSCLFAGEDGGSDGLKQIQDRIKQISPFCGELSSRAKWNYRFICSFPWLYRLIYRLYDKIRTPNWDL